MKMIERDTIHRRGQALEDQYFQRVDQELLRKLREKDEREERLAELTKATGVRDERVATHLVEAGINASNIAAMTLTPLVFVAWASGSVTPEERKSVMSAALRRGVSSNPLAFRLLEQWLQSRPPRDMWGLWKEYAAGVHHTLPAETANKLRQRLLEQAKEVAMASGGVLGVGKICPAEQRVLDEIESTLPTRTDG
ncbi:hypothetical protein [Stieleria mannarensis]|uniref:hypothetical protein n=1 Tax=Stieleria mannarensis TaxID=2755585 RepID=UPI001601C9BE|nr:hypothetical protein [Rhodopirellula sp. JC639]